LEHRDQEDFGVDSSAKSVMQGSWKHLCDFQHRLLVNVHFIFLLLGLILLLIFKGADPGALLLCGLIFVLHRLGRVLCLLALDQGVARHLRRLQDKTKRQNFYCKTLQPSGKLIVFFSPSWRP
jgi:hypothetical protein